MDGSKSQLILLLLPPPSMFFINYFFVNELSFSLNRCSTKTLWYKSSMSLRRNSSAAITYSLLQYSSSWFFFIRSYALKAPPSVSSVVANELLNILVLFFVLLNCALKSSWNYFGKISAKYVSFLVPRMRRGLFIVTISRPTARPSRPIIVSINNVDFVFSEPLQISSAIIFNENMSIDFSTPSKSSAFPF